MLLQVLEATIHLESIDVYNVINFAIVFAMSVNFFFNRRFWIYNFFLISAVSDYVVLVLEPLKPSSERSFVMQYSGQRKAKLSDALSTANSVNIDIFHIFHIYFNISYIDR